MFLKQKNLLFTVMIIIITFCCGMKVKAYYQLTDEKNINFQTAGYTNLTITTDKSTYGFCQGSASINLTISNPNEYAVTYTLGFSNNDLTYTIDGGNGTSFTILSSGSKTHTIVLGGATTNNTLIITISLTGPYKASYTKEVTFDLNCPTASITSTNDMATSQTVTLTMTDDTGVSGYYFGTSSSLNNLDYTNIISVTSTTITKTVDDDGTYYLFVKDVAGNIYNTSVDFYKVILDANSGSVSPTSIVAKSGNTINLPTPTGGSFIEWNTALDESGTSYINSYTGSGTGSITLYAIWELEKTLYSVLKREATSGSNLAKTYTGAHQDSYLTAGTSNIYYYYAFNSTNATTILDKNNVIFAGFCWQMIRTTDTGGVKLIYNGEAVDGKCLNTRATHVGFNSRTTQTLSSNYYYGTSFNYDESAGTFSLTGTLTLAEWSNDTANALIGLYTCKSSSETGTCTTLYYIESKNSSTSAYVLPLKTGAHYSTIGSVEFNASYDLPAYVGYMYNTVYPYETTSFTNSTTMLSSSSLSTNYYYATEAVWGSPTASRYNLVSPYKVSATSEYANLVGNYTFKNSSETYTSSSVYYIVNVDSSTMYYIRLSSGQTLSDADKTYVFGDDITDNGDGTYTLTNPTSVKRSEWSQNYANYKNKYTCNGADVSCAEPLYTTETSTTSFTYINTITKNFIYANSYYYEDGKYHLTGEQQTFWNWTSNYNKINNTHYTCFNTTGVCETISYVYYTNSSRTYHINITGNKSVSDALVEMLSASDVNTTNSTIKNAIDAWYKQNMLSYTSYLEDTIFCNDRSIRALDGWNPSGGSTNGYLQFKEYSVTSDLSCTNETDKFSVSNPNAQLTYPVGLASSPEMNLLGNNTLRGTGSYYWLASPSYFHINYAHGLVVGTTGNLYSFHVGRSNGARPSVSLITGTKYSSGDGSMENPYVVELNE